MTAGFALLILGFAAVIAAVNYFDWLPRRRARSDEERFADAILAAGGYLAMTLAFHFRPDVFVDWFGRSAGVAASGITVLIMILLFPTAKRAIMNARR